MVRGLRGTRRMERVDLHHPGKLAENIYPYGVVVLGSGRNARAYVTCWNDSSVGGILLSGKSVVRRYIGGDRHPTAVTLKAEGRALFLADSGADRGSWIENA